MKLNIKAEQVLDPKLWQPNNWAGQVGPGTRTLGFDSFTLAPVDSSHNNLQAIKRNAENIGQEAFCYGQREYDTYKFIFVHTLVGGKPTLLQGPSGTFKSSVGARLAHDLGLPFVKLDCSNMDPAQAKKALLGGSVLADAALWRVCENRFNAGLLDSELSEKINKAKAARKLTPGEWLEFAHEAGMKDSETYWKEGLLVEAARNGQLLMIDEINRLGPAVADVANFLGGQTVDAGNGHYISLRNCHPNFRVIAAMNPAGQAHPDREPLPAEVHTRFVSCDVAGLSQDELYHYMVHQFTGKQPTLELPDGTPFHAKYDTNHLDELGVDGNTPELQTFMSKFMDARAVAKEATEKMEQGINANNVNRCDTTEPFVFSRRDVQTFKDRLLKILPQAQTKEVMANRVMECFKELYTGHFIRYNRAQGSEVAATVMEAAKQMQLREAFLKFVGALEINSQIKSQGISTDRVWADQEATPEQISKWSRKLTPFMDSPSMMRSAAKPHILWFQLAQALTNNKAFSNEKVDGKTLGETVSGILKEMRQLKIKVDGNEEIKRGVVLDSEYVNFVAKYPELGDFVESCKVPNSKGEKEPRPFGYLVLPRVVMDMLCDYNQVPTVSPASAPSIT